MTKPVHVLVVGFGNMGRNHARVLSDLGHEVRTLDPRIDSGADYGVLSNDLIDWTEVACIAVPIDELSSHADAWINRGKHVLVEKPGATDLATLSYLHQRAEEQGTKLVVGYTERHNPAVWSLPGSLQNVGEIRHINIRRLGYADSDVDPALNLACHDFDVLDYLGFDLEVHHAERVDGHLAVHLVATKPPQGWDGTLAQLNSWNPCSVSVEASHLHPVKIRELEVVGTDGVLLLDYQRRRLSEVLVNKSGVHGGDIHVEDVEPLAAQWSFFFADVYGSTGTKALALAEAVTRWPEHRPLVAA